jgi:hypothetical protein
MADSVPDRSGDSRRTFKSKDLGMRWNDGVPRSNVAKTDSGVEATNYYTGEVFKAGSPKAAVRKAFKQPTAATNNRKEPKVKLNKKETKQAVDNLREDYNHFVVPSYEPGYSTSEWATEMGADPNLKKTAIKTAKETKAKYKSKKITGRGV